MVHVEETEIPAILAQQRFDGTLGPAVDDVSHVTEISGTSCA